MKVKQEKRIVDPSGTEEEQGLEQTLRPRTLDEYVGQTTAKENLRVFVRAARMREEPLDHVLIYGPPGLGKTTLAHIIANELGVAIHISTGPAIERKGDLAGILTNLREREVLFIDEIHRLNAAVEENLYPAMEEFSFDIIIGEGLHARSINMDLQPFTLVGATTRAGLLSSPLRDRFGVIIRLDYYTADEIFQIVQRSARIMQIKIAEDGAWELARRSRGTPRIANRLLRRVRDFGQVKGAAAISIELVDFALDRLEVDRKGLDSIDRKIILTIIEKFGGGPVGIESISAAVGEECDTIEEVCEPYLVKEGFLNRTPRGRVAASLSYEHFGRPIPAAQGKLL